MNKRWLKIGGAVVGGILLVLILIPLLVNGETFRPTVESRLSAALNRKVALGHLSFSLLSGSLVADDISISDDPAFSSSPFLKAKDLKIGVEIGALIFGHQIHITGLAIDEPSIQLIQNQAGKWNYSSMGGSQASSKSPSTAGGSSAVPDFTVKKLTIKDGTATLSSIPATARPFVYSGVDLTVKNLSFASSFPFDLSASLPGSGKLKVNGTAGPIAPADTSETPFHATLNIDHLDPVAAGLVDSSKGISTVADINAQFNSDGRSLTGSGKVKAANLKLARTATPAPEPVNVDFNLANDLRARSGQVKDVAVHAGSATAHITGGYHSTAQALNLDLHLNAPGLSIDQLEKFLPAFGVQIPSGSQLKGGTLTASIAVTGPATAATIAGPVDVENTTLAGFNLGSKIQGLSNLGGGATSGGTQIQHLKATVNSTPQQTEISNIDASVPQIGTATGSGTVSPSGALNFHMVATLSSNNAVGNLTNQAMNTAVNQASGFLGGFLGKKKSSAPAANQPHGIPLVITGTASNPSIHADVGGLAKGFLK